MSRMQVNYEKKKDKLYILTIITAGNLVHLLIYVKQWIYSESLLKIMINQVIVDIKL